MELGSTLMERMARWRRLRIRRNSPDWICADSISLDPHKWLYQPLDCGCLLYRSPEAAQHAFAHSGDYARSLSSDPVEGFAFFEESLELSRRFRALKLWLSLRYHGFAAFRESIRKRSSTQARRLRPAIKRNPVWNCWLPWNLAPCAFVIGEHARSDEVELNRFNAELLKRDRPARTSLSFECISLRQVLSQSLHRESSHEKC